MHLLVKPNNCFLCFKSSEPDLWFVVYLSTLLRSGDLYTGLMTRLPSLFLSHRNLFQARLSSYFYHVVLMWSISIFLCYFYKWLGLTTSKITGNSIQFASFEVSLNVRSGPRLCSHTSGCGLLFQLHQNLPGFFFLLREMVCKTSLLYVNHGNQHEAQGVNTVWPGVCWQFLPRWCQDNPCQTCQSHNFGS